MMKASIYKFSISFLLSVSFIGAYAQNSVFSTGEWHKIKVTETGVYKIDYDFLTSIGFQNKDPKTIKIYGYGGILPQKNSDFRYGDIVENNIYFKGEEDGQIGLGDYILFYGEGPNDIFEGTDNNLSHELNPYEEASYYFITAGGEEGKRVNYSIPSANVENNYSELPYLIFHESEETNIVKSGREWFGDPFRFISERTFNYNLEDINKAYPVNYAIRYAAGSEQLSTSFSTYINNDFIANSSVSKAADLYGNKAYEVGLIGEAEVSSSRIEIKSIYDNKGDAAAIGYLDYIRLVYLRNLDGNVSTCYTLPESYRNSEISISNVSTNTLIWDVSKVNDIKGLLSVDGKVKIDSDVEKLVILNKNDSKRPVYVKRVENQNLHGLSVPELVIITHSSTRESANAFGDFKKNEMGIDTKVIDIGEVYNEYASGSQDVSAIRDFMRDLYQKDEGKLKYLLLFGDCSYDYKGRLSNNTNLVPIYESRVSLHNIASFSSDDYFGLLEDNEGEWIESSGFETVDIGIGRLPIRNNVEGNNIRKKIENYVLSNEAKGNWRNRVLFVADDEDNSTHMSHAEGLSILLNSNAAPINSSKLYLDAYEQVSSSAGQIAPSVNQDFNLKIDRGALIVNYSGHGSEEQWTQEEIMTLSQINKLDNEYKLPFFVTATCEFGRYDDPSLRSGAEQLLFNEKGGAIGLMTTTRPVYASSNLTINTSFYNNVFLRNSDSLFDNLGDVHKRTKNESIITYLNRNFSLLGDPSMKLAYPDYKVYVDSLNGSSIEVLDTIKALETVKVVGRVSNGMEEKDEGFNGTVMITVYDKTRNLTTLGDKGENPFSFEERTSIVFEGEVEVVNGSYEVEFVVPKDISYAYGIGKMSFYALSDGGIEGSGAFSDFIIGGGLDGFNDGLAPEIELFVDDYTFIDGGITGRDPLFLANVFDENGLNTTNTGIGHEMTLMIDDDESNLFVVNDFYKSVDNTYQKGLIEYPLSDLSEGSHKLTLKVWDVNNNSIEEDIWILVSDKGHVQAYPNPFVDQVTFLVDQPRLDIGGDVEIKIFDNLGTLIWGQSVRFDSFTTVIDEIVWDGIGNSGEEISNGIYYVVSEVRYDDSFGNIIENSKVVLQK